MEALKSKPVHPLTIFPQARAGTEPRSTTSDEAPETFKWVLDSIVKYKRFIVRMTVAGALLAVAAMAFMSPSYTATAYLAVHVRNAGTPDVPGSAASAAEEATIDTHLTVMLSDAYLRRLLPMLRELDAERNDKAAGPPTWRGRASTFIHTAWLSTKELLSISAHQSRDGEALAALRKRLRVGQERRSRIISVTFSDSNPLRAAQVANLVAQSYVDELAQQAEASETQALDAIAAQSSAIPQELAKVKAELDASRLGQASTSQSTDLEWKLTTLAQQYETLLRRRQDLATRGLVDEPEVRLIESASQPELPSSLNPVFLALPVTIVFALFACLIAVTLNYFDRTLHTEAAATEALRIPCAGVIPLITLKPGRQHQLTDLSPITPTTDIRSAFVSLLASDPIAARWQRVVLVTSGINGEGKTQVAWSLALCAAQLGKRCLLLDFCHSLRNLRSDMTDLTGVLMHGDPLSDAIRHIQQLGIDYLPAGFPGRDRLWILANPKMSLLFEQLSDSYDLVVIDTPSLQDAPEVRLLARFADHVLLAVRSGRTNRDVTRSALHQLARTEDLNPNVQFWSILTIRSPARHRARQKIRSAVSALMTCGRKIKVALTPWAKNAPEIPIGRRSRNT